MLNSLLKSTQVSVLEKALDAASLRHKVISNNIANVNTPKFKKSEVSFEDQLALALKPHNTSIARTHERHLPLRSGLKNVEPTVNTITTTTLRSDGNNVDIDSEMASLSKNSIYYDAVAQQLNKYFSGIKSAINEGRR
ncbi:flagellar basal body rod protein FlgB [Sporomusa termitida]|uniref:Flagellar basal body rod protein FlgB n=1 Tax=Sporomusa termitida TaxID=2377 RepID=A0A517DT00_9FIRM|nr:flagellar basal body rod protein FlgB [Sporomusa termitida]QDR80484.1 Flagellar basal body rod protein FlgB [Sporomusa termitida]